MKTALGPSDSTQPVTNRLKTRPWKMFLEKLSVTRASEATFRWLSTQKEMAVVEPLYGGLLVVTRTHGVVIRGR